MPAKTTPWRLGVSPLSWTNDVLEDLGADTPVERCLDDAATAGYAGVELGRKFPREPDALANLLSSRGLALASGWHSGFLADRGVEDEVAAVASHARLLTALGANVMVYGECGRMIEGSPLDAPMSGRLTLAGHDLDGYAKRLRDFAERLTAEHGLTLAYHHHLMMVAETFDDVSSLLDCTGSSMGLLLDTGHALAAGFDYARLIDRFGDRITHIHLKDVRPDVMAEVRRRDLSFNAGVRAGMFTVPGDGVVDFGPLARFVAATGYRGWLVVEAEQDPQVAPPLPAVTRARDRVLSLLS